MYYMVLKFVAKNKSYRQICGHDIMVAHLYLGQMYSKTNLARFDKEFILVYLL